MNKTFAITAIVLVAVVMGMSSVAIVLPPATATHPGPQIEKLWGMPCDDTGNAVICKTWTDLNHDGCDPSDPTGKMSMKAISKHSIRSCGEF